MCALYIDEVPKAEGSSMSNEISDVKKSIKRRKPGIIYLSTIPPYMNVLKIREYFSKFGDIGRVFLQKEKTKGARKSKKRPHYTEGWIEFKSKRKAKGVHLILNNKPVGGKNHYRDMLWNIKYLPRFKWPYLRQRLEYEREVHKQRLHAEVSQIRRETDYYLKTAEKSKELKRIKIRKQNTSKDTGEDNEKHKYLFKQRATEEEILKKKELKKKKNEKYKQQIKKNKKKHNKRMTKKKSDVSNLLGTVFVGDEGL